MSRSGWRTWARGVRPVGISTTSCETSPTKICAFVAASASLRTGATGHRPRGRHEDASRLPCCRRRARQAVVLEGIGAAFEQAGRVLAQRRVGIRPRPAEAQRVRQASGPREHSRPLRTPPSGELIRRRIRREAYRSRRAVRQQQRLDAPYPQRVFMQQRPSASARRPETRWRFHLSRCPGFGVHFFSQPQGTVLKSVKNHRFLRFPDPSMDTAVHRKALYRRSGDWMVQDPTGNRSVDREACVDGEF